MPLTSVSPETVSSRPPRGRPLPPLEGARLHGLVALLCDGGGILVLLGVERCAL